MNHYSEHNSEYPLVYAKEFRVLWPQTISSAQGLKTEFQDHENSKSKNVLKGLYDYLKINFDCEKLKIHIDTHISMHKMKP